MANHKPEDAISTDPNEASEATALSLADPTRNQDTADEGVYAIQSRWVSWFGIWGDDEVGVRLIEDRQNKRMTILFDDKPSEAVRALMRSEPYSYGVGSEEEVWFKRINPARRKECREEAEELAFKVVNMMREEKGLEPRKAFSLVL